MSYLLIITKCKGSVNDVDNGIYVSTKTFRQDVVVTDDTIVL
jgi:hypothetical protein